MNRNDVNNFEKISGQLLSIYEEISLLSKKNPNDAINKFKLKFINTIIAESNLFISSNGNYLPYDDFTSFDEDDIPQNSDVVFILAQYLQCLEKLRADNVTKRNGIWFWKLTPDENDTPDDKGFIYLQTIKPKGLRE
ncbi:hypothetical protein [Methylobacillus glycogenes]|uniref:hypothetical protein n=1 Tax=Methylobacillus glycogenes TaxID=406 RepID=UPI00047249DD|nr:hypothetical protein [Methylobacillus glycogenes]